MIKVNWHIIITMIAPVVITMIALGGVMIALMKGFFVTTKRCETAQKGCQIKLCKKIDDLKDDIKEDRKIANTHYAEIKETLGLIKGKLDGIT